MWVKLDDNTPFLPELLDVGADGFALHVAALCHCGRLESDCRFPARLIPTLSPQLTPARAKAAVAELLKSKAWARDGDTVVILAGAKDQPTREENEQRRKAAKERLDRWRAKQENAVRDGVGNGVSNGVGNATRNAAPGPARPGPEVLNPPTPRKRGARRARARNGFEPLPVANPGPLERHCEACEKLVAAELGPDGVPRPGPHDCPAGPPAAVEHLVLGAFRRLA